MTAKVRIVQMSDLQRLNTWSPREVIAKLELEDELELYEAWMERMPKPESSEASSH